MTRNVIAARHNLPDVWGEGALFAFSGMDGETNAASEFVGSYWREPYGLLFHTPRRRILEISLRTTGKVRVATGDVYAVETEVGDLVVAYSAWHTIVGSMPAAAKMVLRMESGEQAEYRDPVWVSADPEHGDVLAGLQEGTRFSLAYGKTVDEARQRAIDGLAQDLATVVEARLAPYDALPDLGDPVRNRLLRKAFDVIRVNTLAPEGAIRYYWSTPDRVPHKHMWLWDTTYHSLAMNRLRPELAWEWLASILEAQRPDGMVPHMNTVLGGGSDITQPPILAWGVWENYLALPDKDHLRQALPRLEAYLEWDVQNRDKNGNGLLEWFIEGNVYCRSGESGLDNSPRFDKAILLDAVDFSVFAARDMAFVARIARELGEAEKAESWAKRSREMAARVHELLWNEDERFYFDREMDGTWSTVRAITGFHPLLLDDLPADRLDALVEALRDPRHFGAAFPVPSVALSDPEHSTDLWRGGTWLNMNYVVHHGLRLQGRTEEARQIAEKSLAYVNKYYERYGVLFEYYDSTDRLPPVACDRKGPRVEPYDIRRKMDSIRDYHWTAAMTTIFLLEGYHLADI
ncbi:MAG: hypothetical protein GX657_02655 [Chloroflexi bacterium]|nr:hypothetical protein [Chloroflexota bacterium]